MDYQKKSSLQIGVSGAGKKYLKMPWSVEDTIENLEDFKETIKLAAEVNVQIPNIYYKLISCN